MQCRGRELHPFTPGEAIQVDHPRRVIVLDDGRKPDVRGAKLFEPAESGDFLLESILLTADFVAFLPDGLEAEADFDVRIGLDDWLQAIGVQAVRADFKRTRLRRQEGDDLGEVAAQRRLATGDVQVVEAGGQLRERLELDFVAAASDVARCSTSRTSSRSDTWR